MLSLHITHLLRAAKVLQRWLHLLLVRLGCDLPPMPRIDCICHGLFGVVLIRIIITSFVNRAGQLGRHFWHPLQRQN